MILVTGANGFVGQAVVKELFYSDRPVRACVRRNEPTFPVGVEQSSVLKLEEVLDWEGLLCGVDIVVHAAGMAHNVDGDDNYQNYYNANVLATINLANSASLGGVKRFVYISSVKVFGEYTKEGSKFRIQDLAMPHNSYAKSKRQAEIELLKISQKSDMEVVIIRPPLIYGPNVKANFLSLFKWVEKGFPVPSALKNAKRSFISLANLVDFILVSIEAPKAANQIFLVSDDSDLSTWDLILTIGKYMGRTCRTIPLPAVVLRIILYLIGKKGMATRLLSSLQVDISETKRQLGWSPKFRLEEGIDEVVRAYKDDLSR
ncbi:SDR family oxidoreductase [Aurantivibrio infirmus]